MAENWCKEHQTAWFKKGKMKGYAHPILDTDGEPTGNWCNRPEAEGVPEPTNEVAPQERGMWWKEVGEMIRADKISKETANGRLMIRAYYAQMFASLDIKIEKEE